MEGEAPDVCAPVLAAEDLRPGRRDLGQLHLGSFLVAQGTHVWSSSPSLYLPYLSFGAFPSLRKHPYLVQMCEMPILSISLHNFGNVGGASVHL